MNTIEQRLKKILTDYGINQQNISRDTDYYFDLNLNMLDLMGLARKIKHEFLVTIPDREILRMERVSDTIYFLERKISSENKL